MLKIHRLFSSQAPSKSFPAEYIINRNPRNLERLCIAHKPDGWHLEKPGKTYYHKIELTSTSRHLTAKISHYTGHVPVSASTKEWAIRKHLYSTLDHSAYRNLGRVIGLRCLETGINEVACFLDAKPGGKLEAFLQEVKDSGVSLTEPPVYVNPRPSDMERPEKPWDVYV